MNSSNQKRQHRQVDYLSEADLIPGQNFVGYIDKDQDSNFIPNRYIR